MSRGIARLNAVFSGGHKALIPYLTAGDPDLETTARLLDAVSDGGADIIELGVPFSDPMADGPVLQLAAERALKNPFSLDALFSLVADFRARRDTPVILFGYYNPFFRYGHERLAERAAEVGADGVLCVDLPPEEAGPLHSALEARGLALVPLLTPVSGMSRIERAREICDAFGYYVSVTGVTGLTLGDRAPTADRVREVRQSLGRPLVVGFGVRTPEDARQVGEGADGVVVGSALVDLAFRSDPSDREGAVRSFVAGLREGLDARGE